MEEKRKIYIVEDEALCQKLYKDMLTREGYEVVIHGQCGSDGEKCENCDLIGKLNHFEPDIIIIDMMLKSFKHYDGCDVITKLKQTRFKDIPVFVVSACSTNDDVVKGLDYCDEYITKPVNFSALVKLIKRYLP